MSATNCGLGMGDEDREFTAKVLAIRWLGHGSSNEAKEFDRVLFNSRQSGVQPGQRSI